MKAEYGMSVEIGPSNWRKVNLTLDAKEGETAHQLMDRVFTEVESWFNHRHSISGATPTESYGPSPLPEIVTEKPIPEEQRKASLVEDIMSCKEIKVLESYKLLAKTSPALQSAYDQRYKKLINL